MTVTEKGPVFYFESFIVEPKTGDKVPFATACVEAECKEAAHVQLSGSTSKFHAKTEYTILEN